MVHSFWLNLYTVINSISWTALILNWYKLVLTKHWLVCHLLHCALTAAQCIVIGPVCLCVGVYVCVCVWVCYHDNSKLRASILTKLGL